MTKAKKDIMNRAPVPLRHNRRGIGTHPAKLAPYGGAPLPGPAPAIHHHERHRRRRARERSALYLLLFLMMLFVLALGIVLAVSFAHDPRLLFSRPQIGQQSREEVAITLAGRSFIFPAPMVAGVHRDLLRRPLRIDLKWPWPVSREDLTIVRPPPSGLEGWVITSLEPREGRSGREERVDPIYSNFFTADEEKIFDLTKRSFLPDSPYTDSELFLAPDGRVLRCDRRPSVLGPIICERLIPIDNKVMARLRFARDRLGDWRDIEETALMLIKRHEAE